MEINILQQGEGDRKQTWFLPHNSKTIQSFSSLTYQEEVVSKAIGLIFTCGRELLQVHAGDCKDGFKKGELACHTGISSTDNDTNWLNIGYSQKAAEEMPIHYFGYCFGEPSNNDAKGYLGQPLCLTNSGDATFSPFHATNW